MTANAQDLAGAVAAEDRQAAQAFHRAQEARAPMLMQINAEQRKTIGDLNSLIEHQAFLLGQQREQMRSPSGIAQMVRDLKNTTPEDVRVIVAALVILADSMDPWHDMSLVADRLQEAHDACEDETKRQSYIGAVVDVDFSGD